MIKHVRQKKITWRGKQENIRYRWKVWAFLGPTEDEIEAWGKLKQMLNDSPDVAQTH